MCGIVGCYASITAVDIVLEGLKRLEYRGYDSAGVSYIDKDHNLLFHSSTRSITSLQFGKP